MVLQNDTCFPIVSLPAAYKLATQCVLIASISRSQRFPNPNTMSEKSEKLYNSAEGFDTARAVKLALGLMSSCLLWMSEDTAPFKNYTVENIVNIISILHIISPSFF